MDFKRFQTPEERKKNRRQHIIYAVIISILLAVITILMIHIIQHKVFTGLFRDEDSTTESWATTTIATTSDAYTTTSKVISRGTSLTTYFVGTDFELEVYHIKGKADGNTLMILGGIQGDESTPYLTLDYFVDLSLEQGNLILIPRANLPSILTSRRLINQDMNRRFAGERSQTSDIYEDDVVDVIKHYILLSDMLLNLHEGGGFYRHTYEGYNHNQMKYGQCIIADADEYFVSEKDLTIPLKTIAETIIERINQQIDIPEYTYRFNNHNTTSPDTKHLEQRKSASYFGLTVAHIPSFGVEVSKSISSTSLKKEYLKMIINEFMAYLDIRTDTPALNEPKPVLHYLLAIIDGEKRYIEPQDILLLDENTTVNITSIHTNYPRGNYVDIVGLGNQNDINKTFTITRNTEINVYKDGALLATIPVRVKVGDRQTFAGFRVHIKDDDSYHNVFAGDTLKVIDGVEFEILGALDDNTDISINLSGATPYRGIINTGTGLSERFAINPTKDLYEFIVSDKNNTIAIAYLKLLPIKAHGLHISHNDKSIVLAPGDTIFASYGDRLYIHDVELEQLSSTKVKVNLAGYVLDPEKDGEDRGGTIYLTPSRLIPSYAVNPAQNLYEIHILYKQNQYEVYRLSMRN